MFTDWFYYVRYIEEEDIVQNLKEWIEYNKNAEISYEKQWDVLYKSYLLRVKL